MGFDVTMYIGESPAQRRARQAERRRELDRRKQLFDAWYRHYRALGLGDWRAREHATKRCSKGKLP